MDLVGTGLCEPCFECALTSTGVDISSNMLKIAQRNLRQWLQRAGRFSAYAIGSRRAVAADVFVYIGDLSEVFQKPFEGLPETEFFCFSVEAGGEDYALETDLRYAHSAAYLACRRSRVQARATRSSVIRHEKWNRSAQAPAGIALARATQLSRA